MAAREPLGLSCGGVAPCGVTGGGVCVGGCIGVAVQPSPYGDGAAGTWDKVAMLCVLSTGSPEAPRSHSLCTKGCFGLLKGFAESPLHPSSSVAASVADPSPEPDSTQRTRQCI